jgi:hypothetical protein
MHKNAMKCNETLRKWCKNKLGASKIMDTFETYQCGARKNISGGKKMLTKTNIFAYGGKSLFCLACYKENKI